LTERHKPRSQGRCVHDVNRHTREYLSVKAWLVRFFQDEQGLTMVEYAIAGALVTAAAVGAFTNLGNAVVTRITALVTAVNA
jgi:pilus assembly protein Flp/PilA